MSDYTKQQNVENILLTKVAEMQRDFSSPGVQLNVKRKADGSISYIRRCMTAAGDLEYLARWNVPEDDMDHPNHPPAIDNPPLPARDESVSAVDPPAPPVLPVLPDPPALPDPPVPPALRPCVPFDEIVVDGENEEADVETKEEKEQDDEDYVPSSSESDTEMLSTEEEEDEIDEMNNFETQVDPPAATSQAPTSSAINANVTPSPHRSSSNYCTNCDNYPCVNKTSTAEFLLQVAKKNYDDADHDKKTHEDIMDELLKHFMYGYKLMVQYDQYVPGDTHIDEVDAPFCLYNLFHEWSKDLL